MNSLLSHSLRKRLLSPLRDAAVVLLLLASPAPSLASANSSVYQITVSGMVCSFCAQGIEKRLNLVPGAESVRIDLNRRLVEVTAKPGVSIDQTVLRRAIQDAGYAVRRIETQQPAGKIK